MMSVLNPVWTREKVSWVRVGAQSGRSISIIRYANPTDTISEGIEECRGPHADITETVSESVVVTEA